MKDHSSTKNLKELNEAKINLQSLQTEWLETLEDLAAAKEETRNEDLFATIDYLTFCDQLCKNLSIELKEIDSQLKHLEKLRGLSLQDERNLEVIDNLIGDMQGLRESKQKKMLNVDDEYSMLAESVLRRSEDITTQFAAAMSNEKVVPNLETQINQNLEKQTFLEELRDSLESYRQAREDYISELEINDIQKLPEDQIHEDLGEENPEIDSILSQLDTIISSCDAAILIQDIEE